MKSIKLHLLTFALLATASVFGQQKTETTFKTKDFRPWGFELKNKDKDAILIQLVQGGKKLVDVHQGQSLVAGSKGTKEEQHGYLRVSGLNPQEEFTLLIYPENQNKGDINAGFNAKEAYKFKANKDRKVIAITREKSKLRPQTGKYGGSSQSGLNLYKNVKENEIEAKSGLAGVSVY